MKHGFMHLKLNKQTKKALADLKQNLDVYLGSSISSEMQNMRALFLPLSFYLFTFQKVTNQQYLCPEITGWGRTSE